ncbi:unnamed protein product [Lactuca virosa]|uniref:Uncharacterized protein n=1 Tax=Lactuca virosa TaxID=75947 RepID=A0AAU9PQV1_9ASTR|nr:unnamed protein product [Lactuca virosa]
MKKDLTTFVKKVKKRIFFTVSPLPVVCPFLHPLCTFRNLPLTRSVALFFQILNPTSTPTSSPSVNAAVFAYSSEFLAIFTG